jgi:Flp pilus assembly protein TadD
LAKPPETGPSQPHPATLALPSAEKAAALIAEANHLLSEGEALRACEVGARAAELAPDVAAIHRLLGRCYMRIGQLTDGRAHYRRFLELVPDAPDAVYINAIVNRQQ